MQHTSQTINLSAIERSLERYMIPIVDRSDEVRLIVNLSTHILTKVGDSDHQMTHEGIGVAHTLPPETTTLLGLQSRGDGDVGLSSQHTYRLGVEVRLKSRHARCLRTPALLAMS